SPVPTSLVQGFFIGSCHAKFRLPNTKMQKTSGSSFIQKRLILRLSSLGDVILSSAALETESSKQGVDWVVAKEYGAVLRGHPRIRKLWEFDRRENRGFDVWRSFGRELWEQNFTEVIDLHGSIRTRILWLMFLYWSMREGRTGPRWTVASKQRFRSWGFILFKKLWPKFWLSRLQVEVFARAAGGSGQERPNMRHLLLTEEFSVEALARDFQDPPRESFGGKPYICVMPGSTWPGKTWAAEKYVEVLKQIKVLPVIMGTARDSESVSLVRLLEAAGVPHESGVGKWNLRESAQVLANSKGYLGSDTGLALLSESLGVEILVIYGPTAPGLGFEPWRVGSRTAGSDLWCRPCGKIGHRCYRPKNKFLCLQRLSPAEVLPIVQEKFCGMPGSGLGRSGTVESGSVSSGSISLGPGVSPGARVYLWIWKEVVERWVLPSKMGVARIQAGSQAVQYLTALPLRVTNKMERPARFWFHAASAGELESLWPVVVELQKVLKESSGSSTEFILSAFSASAEKSLMRLGTALSEAGAHVLYCGLSPWEGHWRAVLKVAQPDCFITAKYEAWPDLWMSLAAAQIPLAILGARARKSLRIGKRLCELFGAELPRMLLLPVLEREIHELRRDFPASVIQAVGEPRWDRVLERSQTGNQRAKRMISYFAKLPRPWGIFGSIWPQDLEVWGEQLRQHHGTLWMVPHRTESEAVQELEHYFTKIGMQVLRTSRLPLDPAKSSEQLVLPKAATLSWTCVLVDEIGFLSELYSAADWAYVGGGFGQGIHSTIEPAIHGIPVASGPARAERFSEVQQLGGSGQLQILRNSADFKNWMDQNLENRERREVWNQQVKSYLGASSRAVEALMKFSKTS
ncbi:MAG: hypothetical protein A2Z97_01205, partial [Bdellovibrionales bacterium GWB1_52_6]